MLRCIFGLNLEILNKLEHVVSEPIDKLKRGKFCLFKINLTLKSIDPPVAGNDNTRKPKLASI